MPSLALHALRCYAQCLLSGTSPSDFSHWETPAWPLIPLYLEIRRFCLGKSETAVISIDIKHQLSSLKNFPPLFQIGEKQGGEISQRPPNPQKNSACGGPKLLKNLIFGRFRAFGSLKKIRPSVDFEKSPPPPLFQTGGKKGGEFLKRGGGGIFQGT